MIEKEKSKILLTNWGAPNFKIFNYLSGYRAYLINIMKYCEYEKRKNLQKTLSRIENVIDRYY